MPCLHYDFCWPSSVHQGAEETCSRTHQGPETCLAGAVT